MRWRLPWRLMRDGNEWLMVNDNDDDDVNDDDDDDDDENDDENLFWVL